MKLSSFAAPCMAALLLACAADAFAPALPRAAGPVLGRSLVQPLRMAEEGEGLPPLPSQKDSPKEAAAPAPVAAPVEPTPVAASTAVEEPEGTSYPIDLPSPVLLGASMVLAISSTGSLFEVTGGGPTTLGFWPTAAIASLGLPLSIFLIYAAIMKGAAETEEDDREYNKPRGL